MIIMQPITASTITSSPYYGNSAKESTTRGTEKGASQRQGGGEADLLKSQVVQELAAADREVRAHESAHLAAGGGVVTGGASFSYTRGPDGKMYATGGEVPIDASEESDPDATIQKAQRIRAAALAPADPSPQDYKVAAMAIMMEQGARLEKMRELQDRLKGLDSYAQAATALNQRTGGASA